MHRDIKPDNIGIRSLTKQRNQLILFDFSLARAPLDNINVGTEGYRDPFLKIRKPPRWDLAAERYSAAVTLYEMTLGHGVLPQWGSGKSDPALTDDELVIDAEKFDPERAGWAGRVLPQGAASGAGPAVRQRLTRCRRRGGRSSRSPNNGRSRRRPAKKSISASRWSKPTLKHAGCRPWAVDPCPQCPGTGQRHHGA